MAIIFRTAGAWGAGKGTDLDPAEVDNNFWDLLLRVVDLESEGIQPKEIFAIDVTGNQMTITLDDLTTVFGPYTLPTAAFTWADEWQAGIAYEPYDIFVAEEGMYLVRFAHTSASEFDPAEGDSSGDFYQLIFPYPTTHDIGFFFPGTPGRGIEPGQAMFAHISTRDFYFEADLPLSVAKLLFAPDADMSFSILKNTTEIGTLEFGAGQTDGTFSFATNVQFNAGDRLRVLRDGDPLSSEPSEPDPEYGLDASAFDLMVTFRATKGTL
jgi:hypothetical protein